MKILAGMILGFLLLAGSSSKPVQETRSKEGEACAGVEGHQCEEGLWCDLQGRCDDQEAGGVCVKISQTCTDEAKPVCGCDNHTYPNDCERQRVRVQKNHEGACEKEQPPTPGS
ncbi:MAG TPA: Kazal-type serine protease inhibitor family protein [Candidatus Polarisedimenticolia bacterium]|nr:Kazal-type serine protease inhibitor family protein [Candidatus Polarisedimenticolia bacterium]